MYFIIEGMPCSGKTTLAKSLSRVLNAEYIKSSLPHDKYGNILREIRDSGKYKQEIDCLHIADLFRNELQIQSLLYENKNIVRDKCFLSSMAHYLVEMSNIKNEIDNAVLSGYEEIFHFMATPDLLVLLDFSFDDLKQNIERKNDKSHIDKMILENEKRYKVQRQKLVECANHYYKHKVFVIQKQISIDNMVGDITNKLRSTK